ncbi:MAG TPA: hypothetical protein VHV83_02490 [Armatimonadota bacterium]|nr:hypothetical protein [Armatimonadota bacterium]
MTNVATVIRDIAGWPLMIELKKGETYTVKRQVKKETVTYKLTLLAVREIWEPDYYISNNPGHRTLAKAEVDVDVSGMKATLLLRPYQQPVTVNGLQLYVEATKNWGTMEQLYPLTDMTGDVRLSICAAGEGWGPDDLLFPIKNYRWRSATYQNTWTSLVPYNAHYYHRGEDFGAIPDILLLQAIAAGEITMTPVPNGDGKSNSLTIKTADGIDIRFAHMNIETIDHTLTLGTKVTAGHVVAKTGCTWNGQRSQSSDPHVHVDFSDGNTAFSAYPFLTSAYFRVYPDVLLPVSGGYYFTVPGGQVELDGSRSQARPGHSIKKMYWVLHSGENVEGSLAVAKYDTPGLYSEELHVIADDGTEDRDFAQVRVYSTNESNTWCGWAYYSPTRNIKPGDPVTFRNRLLGGVTFDPGDGSPMIPFGDGDLTHTYLAPGIYTVTLSAVGPRDEPFTLRMRVIVDQP